MKFMHMPLFLVADIGSTVSLAEVRRHFLSGSRRYRGALCVRILHKSRLMYYGKADQKCECPYKVRGQIQDMFPMQISVNCRNLVICNKINIILTYVVFFGRTRVALVRKNLIRSRDAVYQDSVILLCWTIFDDI